MVWTYNGDRYGEHDCEGYPGSIHARLAVVSDMLYDQDFDVEFERWLDDEFAPHDLYGMICDAMKGLKGAESVFTELWDYFTEDMAKDPEFLTDHGAAWEDDEDEDEDEEDVE